ncbi:MAG: phage tail tape measure protein [Dokdonella sp.]|nr:phage tail tape measure protein [Dokdonella sp.]
MAKPYEEAIRLILSVEGDEEIAALTKRMKDLASGSDIAAGQATQLADELQKLATTSNNIRDFTKLKATVAETGAELEKARSRMHALVEEMGRSSSPTDKLQRDVRKAATEVASLTKQHNLAQVALQRTSGSLRAAGIDTENLTEAFQQVRDEVGSFSQRVEMTAEAARKAGKETKSAAGGVSALDRAADKGGRSLASIATRLTAISAAATAAIKGMAALSGAALFKGGIRSAVELEQALSEVRAVSGATADELNAMKLAAEAGGRATRFSALEAAQGLGELARATGSAQTAIAALPATLSLAQAAGIGVAEAAQFITTTLTQYGLAAGEAGRVSDVLAMAANATTADVQGLGNALSYAAPLAKQLGMDAEETVAIIGALADQGFRGERAGTALRNVFTSLQDPSSAFAKELRALGISTTDFVEILEALKKSGKDGERALLSLDAAARPAIVALGPVNTIATIRRSVRSG